MKPIWEEYDTKTDLFISAGAGTGKTHTISAVYVSLFDRAFRRGRKLGVENVVTITFTRKAAREMKKKIVEMIEERVSDSNTDIWNQLLSSMIFAWISTIDSFANRILTESGLLVGVDPGFKVASESRMRYSLNRAVLWTLSENLELAEPLLKFYTVDQIVNKLIDALARHRYNLQSSRVITRVDLDIPLHADREEGELLKKATENFYELFQLAYDAYLQELEREKLMDFTEVLMKLRRVLRDPENEWLRERYKQQFRYIIVDEFQDTNFLQKEIIDLLKGTDTRVIYVGDAKQSIYRFRGAEVEVFSQAAKEIEENGGRVYQLSVNFRSHPKIVEFNNRLFKRIFTGGKDYAPSYSELEPLRLANATDSQPRVKLLVADDERGEAKAVARFIESIVGNEFEFSKREKDGDEITLVAEKRPVRYSDIAVLFRRGKGVIPSYSRVFEEHGIPYYVVGETGFFDLPEISGLLSFLKLLSNPLDNAAMVSTLLSPVVGLDLDDLLQLKKAAKSSTIGSSLFYGLDDVEFDEARGRRFELFKKMLHKYIPLKAMMKPSELLEAVVDELNYESHLARFDPSGRRVANLRKLLSTAKGLDEAGISLRELMRRLRHFGPEDEEQASLESEETDAVQMMTVHKAKGLEFPIVVVVDTSWSVKEPRKEIVFYREVENETAFLLSPRSITEGAENDDTVLGKVLREDRERNVEEEKRTLYVALTRAVDLVVVTFALKSRKSRNNRVYWRDLLTRHFLVCDGEGVELDGEFEDLVEITTSPFSIEVDSTTSQQELSPLPISTVYTKSLEDRSYKEYIAPTTLTSTITQRALITDVELLEKEETTDRRDLGILAHEVLEAVGNGTTLKSLMNARPAFVDSLRFDDEDLKQLWSVLSVLEKHELVKEMEFSHCLNEFELAKPFGRHILYGKLDKLVETPKGWKIVDFKFASSTSHSEKYEFQMKFYLYLARDIFRPLLGAFLLYLKDGVVKEISLEDEAIPAFESQLKKKIKEYHERLREMKH